MHSKDKSMSAAAKLNENFRNVGKQMTIHFFHAAAACLNYNISVSSVKKINSHNWEKMAKRK